MNKLEIDFDYLIFAWRDDSPDTAYYLDSDTGSVVLVQRDLEDIEDLRDEIEMHPNRYLYVPKPDSLQPQLDLFDFIFTISDPELKAQLTVAAEGHDKFGGCRRVLRDYPEETARWDKWQLDAVRERVRKWLAAHDLEPS